MLWEHLDYFGGNLLIVVVEHLIGEVVVQKSAGHWNHGGCALFSLIVRDIESEDQSSVGFDGGDHRPGLWSHLVVHLLNHVWEFG